MNDDDISAPKLKRAGQGIYVALIENPWILLVIVVILLTLLYLYPVQTTLFFVTVSVSISMATIMHLVLNSNGIKKYGLTPIEKAVISGGIAGITGFIVGTWSEIKILPYMDWSPLKI